MPDLSKMPLIMFVLFVVAITLVEHFRNPALRVSKLGFEPCPPSVSVLDILVFSVVNFWSFGLDLVILVLLALRIVGDKRTSGVCSPADRVC